MSLYKSFQLKLSKNTILNVRKRKILKDQYINRTKNIFIFQSCYIVLTRVLFIGLVDFITTTALKLIKDKIQKYHDLTIAINIQTALCYVVINLVCSQGQLDKIFIFLLKCITGWFLGSFCCGHQTDSNKHFNFILHKDYINFQQHLHRIMQRE